MPHQYIQRSTAQCKQWWTHGGGGSTVVSVAALARLPEVYSKSHAAQGVCITLTSLASLVVRNLDQGSCMDKMATNTYWCPSRGHKTNQSLSCCTPEALPCSLQLRCSQPVAPAAAALQVYFSHGVASGTSGLCSGTCRSPASHTSLFSGTPTGG